MTEEESVLAAETRAKWEAEQAEKRAAEGASEEAPAEVENEVFYTFRWAPKPRGNRRPQGDRPQGQGRRGQKDGAPRGERREGQGGKPARKGKGGKPASQAPKTYSSRPEKKADPDSPFAILAQLKDQK